MKTWLSKALLLIAVLAGALVLIWLLWFRPSKDVTVELQEVFSATNSEPVRYPATTGEAGNVASPAPAAGVVRYYAQPIGSKVKIAGTSSVHDWTMESIVIGGFMEVDADFPESALTNANAATPKVESFMPVRTFKSYAKRMDEVMQEQMDEPKHKRIEYRLFKLKPKSASSLTGSLQFEAIGVLTVKGTTRTNTMLVTIEKKDGKIKVTGSTPLKMTDFGVQPPKITIPILGSITTGDEIKITIEWLTAPKAQ